MVDKDLQALQEVRNLVSAARKAADELAQFSQEKVDRIVEAMAQAGTQQAEALARLAVEETGLGRVESKIEKNRFATVTIYEAIKGMKTCGLVRRQEKEGIIEFAEPFGVIAGIIPTTNPTSTALFKILVAIKTRNTIVLSPHPRAIRCIMESARILYEAGLRHGLPAGSVGCMSLCTLEATNELMQHRFTSLILSTGGAGIVKAAYSSGKPAIGVGPGNVPVYVDRSAIISNVASGIFASETFDWGTICATEQSIVVHQEVKEALIRELKKRKAYFLTPEQTREMEKHAVKNNLMNPDFVGQSPQKIGELAHIQVPSDAMLLISEYEHVGKAYPLSLEILAPFITLYTVKNAQDGLERCHQILNLGGRGHSLGIYSEDESQILEFARKLPVFRVLVNSPTAQGAIGLSTSLFPSMTLGCGTYGNNITSDNVGPLNLLNWKRVAYINEEWKQKLGYLAKNTTSPSLSSNSPSLACATNPVSLAPRVSTLTAPALGANLTTTSSSSSSSSSLLPSSPFQMTKEDIQKIIHQALGQAKNHCPMAVRCASTECENNK